MTIGEKIGMLRKEHQLSQESLSMLIDVSRQSISKGEQLQAVPSAENLLRLSEIFQVSVEELMNEELQIYHQYNTLPRFITLWIKVLLPMIILVILFLVFFIISIYLKVNDYNENLIFISISFSGACALSATIIFWSTVLRYVYIDCKARKIKPLFYTIISITVPGLLYYLFCRDALTKFD